MPPIRPFDTPTMPDIPVLQDVVTAGDGKPLAPKSHVAPPTPALPTPPKPQIRQDLLNDMLTERIAALTDRLLREASNDIQDLLMDKIWQKLRWEIPSIVAEALKENGHSE
ncbi:MAG: hypothetical protein ACRETQ_13250 [Gammaproteobacteria bacterium]